jgi:AcrR family transcriptional regulator
MQQRSEETIHRINQAALKLFSQNGYDATGIAEICAEAAVSKGAFYHHYASKQAVFITLFAEWLQTIRQQIEIVEQGQKSVPDQIRLICGTFQEVLNAADGRLQMFLEFWTQSSRNPAVWEITIAPYRQFQQFFADLLRKGVDEGSISITDFDDSARIMVGLAVGILLQGLLDPSSQDWNGVALKGIEYLLVGMKGK